MDQQDKDRLAIARQRNREEAQRCTTLYSEAAKHVDEPSLITDADRAALNIKFEYERAKKLRAAEAQAKGLNTPSNLLPGQAQMLNMTPAERVDWYREPMVTMITPEYPRPSILKLALSLAVRFLLVLGVAILVLAVVAK